MLSRVKNVAHFSLRDPAILIVGFVALILAAVFTWEFRYSALAVQILPVVAIAVCIGLLLVPQKRTTVAIAILAGASIPFAHFALFVAFGEGIQWMHLFGGLIVIHMIARMFLGSKLSLAPATPWVIGILLASFVSILGAFNRPGEYVLEFWKSEIQLLFAVLVYIAVTQLRIENRHILLLMKILILISVGVALYGFYLLPARFYGWPGGVLKLTNISLSAPAQSIGVIFYMIRSSSIFSEPSYYGHYMNGMIALSLTAALHRPKIFGSPWIIWLILAIQFLGLLISFAMSAYYMFAIVLFCVILTESMRNRIKISVSLALLVVAGLALTFLVEKLTDFQVQKFIFDRVHGIWLFLLTGDTGYFVGPESVFQRIDTARIAMNVWLDYPILGVGLGGYTLISYVYGDINPMGFSANVIVNTFAEMGIVGAVPLFGMMISSLYGAWRIFRFKIKPTDNDNPEMTEIRLLARMVFFLMLVEVVYFHIQGSFFWPSVWYYLGLGGLIAVKARRLNNLPAGAS